MKNNAMVASLGFLLVVPTAALAVPITGGMSFGVSIGAGGQPEVSDTSSDSWAGGVPATLNVDALATAPNGSTAFGSGTGTWAADGNSGVISMRYGWNGTDLGLAGTNLSPFNWSYSFIADATGNFVMDYNVVGSGDMFGLWGFVLTHNLESGTGAPVIDAFDPSSSGQFVGAVVAGQSYTVSLNNNGNISSSSGSLDASASASGEFSWRMTATGVPDGGSTVALLGLALTGFVAMRRGR